METGVVLTQVVALVDPAVVNRGPVAVWVHVVEMNTQAGEATTGPTSATGVAETVGPKQTVRLWTTTPYVPILVAVPLSAVSGATSSNRCVGALIQTIGASVVYVP